MKTSQFLSLCLVWVLAFTSCTQATVPNALIPQFEAILEQPTVLTELDPTTDPSIKYLALPYDFGSGHIKDSTLFDLLQNVHIRYITYAYTSYKEVEDFDQEALNSERLYDLYKIRPDLFDPEQVEWHVVEQTRGDSAAEAKNLFHGFVIYYRDAPSKESMKREVAFIDRMLDSIPKAEMVVVDAYIITSKMVFVHSKDMTSDDYSWTESMTDSTGDGSAAMVEPGTYYFGNHFQDTTVAAALNRNPHWNNMLIHCDLTGSMSPYSAQLFVWHKLNFDQDKVQHFVFFNDGDMTPDRKKRAGETGGIYHSRADDFDSMMDVARKCMWSGGGGDAPENDIEALLEGFDQCPDCGDIILIADNWANMRDYKFLEKVDRPVRIILCGAHFGINIQYLELARATGGSIHTMEEDLENLMDLNEGETVTIGQHKFQIENGRFVELRKI